MLTLGRAAWVLALSAGAASGILVFASRLYRRQERHIEREYLRWLQRAQALPPSAGARLFGPPDAAV